MDSSLSCVMRGSVLDAETQRSETVDGRNPAPVDRQSLPLFTRFCTSQVVQDFFHQQEEWFSCFSTFYCSALTPGAKAVEQHHSRGKAPRSILRFVNGDVAPHVIFFGHSC